MRGGKQQGEDDDSYSYLSLVLLLRVSPPLLVVVDDVSTVTENVVTTSADLSHSNGMIDGELQFLHQH